MHALRTIREFIDHARTSPEVRPNLLRLHETPLTHRLLLACVGESETTATGENVLSLRGRCERGERLIAHVPQSHWQTITFVAGLRQDVTSGVNFA